MWIARDKGGSLYTYLLKPRKGDDKFFIESYETYHPRKIESWLYPEVTFENSPKELIVK